MGFEIGAFDQAMYEGAPVGRLAAHTGMLPPVIVHSAYYRNLARQCIVHISSRISQLFRPLKLSTKNNNNLLETGAVQDTDL